MDIIFYLILFSIGIMFGSFYTLAVYRIPKKQDILYTRSYCPNCNHKLSFLDLIPVFSYIFLRGKCRHCGEKIRARYLVLELMSGAVFTAVAYFIGLSIYNLNIVLVIDYIFFALSFTFVALTVGIFKEYKRIEKPVLIYGIIISILYIIYLCVVDKI